MPAVIQRSKGTSWCCCWDFVFYLEATKNIGIILDQKKKSLDFFADANFYGKWQKWIARKYIITVKSHIGHAIMYVCLTAILAMNLHTKIALSTTKANHTALLQSLWNCIPFMLLLQENKKMCQEYLYLYNSLLWTVQKQIWCFRTGT